MSSLVPTPGRSSKPRVRFNEEGIAVDMRERGVLYGTQKIDQIETPYIYYDPERDPIVAQYTEGAPGPEMVASELQEKLGLLAREQKLDDEAERARLAADGAALFAGASASSDVADSGSVAMQTPPPKLKKWEQAERRMEFEARRRELYAKEGHTFKANLSEEGENTASITEDAQENTMGTAL
eukprot:g3615.t1